MQKYLKRIANGIHEYKKTVRWRTWWHSKIAPLLGFAYLYAYIFEITFLRLFFIIASIITLIVPAASYGYSINDLMDNEKDSIIERKKLFKIREKKRNKRICITSILFSLASMIFFDFPVKVLVAVAGIYVLATIYIIPQIRLKEKGVLGLISDVLAVHTIPIFITTYITSLHVTDYQVNLLWNIGIWVIILWSIIGLRGIIGHQIKDYRNDIITGTRTFTTQKGFEKSKRIIQDFLIPLEIVFLGSFFTFIVFIDVKLIIVPIIAITGFLIMKQNRKDMKKLKLDYLFFKRKIDVIYEIIIGMSSVILISIKNPIFIIFLITNYGMFRKKHFPHIVAITNFLNKIKDIIRRDTTKVLKKISHIYKNFIVRKIKRATISLQKYISYENIINKNLGRVGLLIKKRMPQTYKRLKKIIR